MQRFLAYLVHIFTAAGAWAGVKACCAISAGHDREAFLFMFLAIIIDSVDGSLARACRIEEQCPELDGRRLDDMVDYFTWVVTPVYFMVHFGVLPPVDVIWALPLVCSALGMAHREAKTEDDYFRGFPSLWNVVALYLWAGGLPTDCNAGIVVALSLAVLAPIKFIYPSKTPACRTLTVAWMSLWVLLVGLSLVLTSWWGRACFLLSLSFPVYYLGLSIYLNFDTNPRSNEGALGGSGN